MIINEPRQSKKNIFQKYRYIDIDDKDFTIKPLKQMRLIDSIMDLDDECEFEMNMYNFGDDENLPDSDRAMDKRCKNK